MTDNNRTRLGEYFIRRAVNQSQIARRTGLNKQRISKLAVDKTTRLEAVELYLIAVAMEASPCELFELLCGHLKDQVDTSLP